MDEKRNIVKILGYDKFKCIADKCKYTCCTGWDIEVDDRTYNKWSCDKANSILENIKIIENYDRKLYSVKKNTEGRCPFLDGKGLCNIVKTYGEQYLSMTCKSFPRVENIFGNRRELTLSCACPVVVDLLEISTKNVEFDSEIDNDLIPLRIRDTIVKILRKEDIKLEYKLIFCYEMLLEILDEETDINNEGLEKFKDNRYIANRIKEYEYVNISKVEGLEELNNLFLDIVQEYRKIDIFETLLKDISIFSENIDIKDFSEKWSKYKKIFEYTSNRVLENCIISKIYSSCALDDIEEMIIAYEMIIIEFLLIRYSVFLRYIKDKNNYLDMENIKEYIVAFSRIVGNNAEAMEEFFQDGFDDSILELGYLCFITLF